MLKIYSSLTSVVITLIFSFASPVVQSQSVDGEHIIEIIQCNYVADANSDDLALLNQQWREWTQSIDAINFTRSAMVPFLPEEGVDHDVVFVNEYPSEESRHAFNSKQAESGEDIVELASTIVSCDGPVAYNTPENNPPANLNDEFSIALLGYCQLEDSSSVGESLQAQQAILDYYSDNGFQVYASQLLPVGGMSNDFTVYERWSDMSSFDKMLGFWNSPAVERIFDIMNGVFSCGGDVFYEKTFVHHGT